MDGQGGLLARMESALEANDERRRRVRLEESPNMTNEVEAGLRSFSFDEPLENGPENTETVGGSAGFTPGRRSNMSSRPHSRPTSRPQSWGNRERSPIQPAGVDATTRRRVVSRRKERRWDNDRRIGTSYQIFDAENWKYYNEEHEEFDVTAASKVIYAQDYTSCFDGFNDELRRQFLDCEGGFVHAGAMNGRTHKRKMNNTPSARFSRVDKSLRKHLLDVVRSNNLQMQRFLETMEKYLLTSFEVVDKEIPVPELLQRTLLKAPVRRFENGEPILTITCRNAHHRLMVHGVCQFHGLTSRSFDGQDGNRIMKIQYHSFDSVMAGWTRPDLSDSENELIFGGETTFNLIHYLKSVCSNF